MTTSTDLARTQDVFIAAVQRAEHGEVRARTPAVYFENLAAENPRIPPDVAASIYRNNVSGGRAKALAVAYPACARILGAECFEGIARHFSESTPATHADLNLYGAEFADFLEQRVTVLEAFSDYAYLGDLARLEWLCHVAYYATDDAPFDFEQLARSVGGSGESLKLRLGNSVGLLRSEYPVMSIREVNLADGNAASVSAADCPQHFVVWRSELNACVEQVDRMTFDLLAAIESGATLGEIASTRPEAAAVLSDSVPRLIQRGWIAGTANGKTAATEVG